MKIKNKELIQSYVLTTAKYKFSIYEKRVLYRIVEIAQNQLEGQKLNKGFEINKTLFGDYVIRMPLTAFEKGGSYNTSKIKQALRELRKKDISFENDFVEEIYGLIEEPKFYKPVENKYPKGHNSVIEKPRINFSGESIEDIPPGTVEFRINPKIYQAALNFSKGWRKFELTIALNLESTYAMRMYELVSRQNNPLTFLISDLREMWGLHDKYKDTSDFFRYTIDKAKKELDAVSPWSFTYKKGKTGNKYTSVTFFPKHISKNDDPNLVKRSLNKELSLNWDPKVREIKNYLQNNWNYTEKELKSQRQTLEELAAIAPDPTYFLSSLKASSRRAKKGPKPFVIGAIRSHVANLQGFTSWDEYKQTLK